MFLKISQNLQENICHKASFLTDLQAKAGDSSFSVNFMRFSRTPGLQNTSGRLLLESGSFCNYTDNNEPIANKLLEIKSFMRMLELV